MRNHPHPRRAPVALLAALVVLLGAACGDDTDARGNGPEVEPAVDGDDASGDHARDAPGGPPPPEWVDHPDDWVYPNRDPAATRAVLDGPIDAGTVDRLTEVWRHDLPGAAAFGNAATNPLVVGDTVYVGDLTTVVHALDRATGDVRWTAGEAGQTFGPSGVAVGWGKVFGTQPGERGRGAAIVAYDAATGEERWATDITEHGGEVNIQPAVHGGRVLAATSSLSFPGSRGHLFALDEATGDIDWAFDTIDSDDLWGNPDVNSGGGSWYPPAFDLARGVAYFGTSNPFPFPGAPGFPNGSSRPGDNRWTNSTLALDLESGTLRWGFQAWPHDIFDRDHVVAALAETEEGAVVVSTGKGGVVFGLDPDTGEERWSVPVGVHENADLTELTGPVRVLPGAQGGVLTPVAVAEGIVYAAANNAATRYEGPEHSSRGFETELGSRPGTLAAIDAASGAVVWDVEIDGDPLGGMTVVNDLVFTATLQGRIVALDRATGAEVWEHRADGGINGWPAVAGDLVVWPVGFADPSHLVALRIR